MPKLAHSHSSQDVYRNCPWKYFRTKVKKDIKEDFSGPQAEWGKKVHTAFEYYIKDARPLPVSIKHHKPMLDKILSANGSVSAELKLTLNRDLQKTTWYAKDAWIRAMLDCTIINGKKAVLWDWKTGKQKDDFDQLLLCAGMTSVFYPEVEDFTLAYYWTKNQKITHQKIDKDDATGFLANRIKLFNVIEEKAANNDFPKSPNPLCGWCSVLDCEHNTARK